MKAKEPLSCLLQQPKVYSKDRSIWKQVHVLCAFLKRALLDFSHLAGAVPQTASLLHCVIASSNILVTSLLLATPFPPTDYY